MSLESTQIIALQGNLIMIEVAQLEGIFFLVWDEWAN